jgi:hypothetical protein
MCRGANEKGGAMGGVKAELDDLVAKHDLPMEAFAGSCTPLDISDYWLRRAQHTEQISAIIAWFEARYFVPKSASHLQKALSEGLTISAAPIITQRFNNCVLDYALKCAIEILNRDGGHWAPVQAVSPSAYDEDFAIHVALFSTPAQKTIDRLKEIQSLEFTADDLFPSRKTPLIRNLAFGAAITALESFLWETMVYWVENDDAVVHRIITTHPSFKDQLIKLSTIFDKQAVLRTDILGFMQGVVWHNWEKVSILYKYGLGLTDLNLNRFTPAVLKRHDIVHRSGFTKAGDAVKISTAEISDLCGEISAFAMDVSSRIEEEKFYVPF